MKDLFVYTADADAQQFLKSILNRPQALSIKPIEFHVERHTGRDSGMVQSGAELARMQKKAFRHALLTLDHHGSGRVGPGRLPQDIINEIQGKLNKFSWSDRSSVVIFVPELEQWLWHAENAMLAHFELTGNLLNSWVDDRAKKLGRSVEDLKTNQPKELFEYIIRDRLRRTISPRDFEEIGKRAGVDGLMKSQSFAAIVNLLRCWFPYHHQPAG